jgi:cytochrome c biogenesis protein CcmG/thiol:disulfide interchange protein DsbE
MLLGLVSKPLYSQQQEACTVTDKAANLDFVLLDMDGAEVKLSDYLGIVILLDFWATWCAPCRIEIPGFIELFDKYEARGLSILGISVDDSVDALQLYAEEMEMDYPVLIGDGRDDVKDAFGPLYGFPTTFLINREGDICHQHTGYAPKEQFEQEILSLL